MEPNGSLSPPSASFGADPALFVHPSFFPKPTSISKGLNHTPSQGRLYLAEPYIRVITIITKSQANFGISYNSLPTSAAQKLLFFQSERVAKKKMIGSIHYISIIFSNRESICIIPGLIKDLAPCKYYVSNPHILPPHCASGVYLSNNWYALLQRNSG